MHYFIGKNQDNHVPISNGRILGWIQQYDTACRPIDMLNQLFYPTFDVSNALLDEEGSYILVKDEKEKVWYDPYGIVQEKLGQIGEIISIDHTQFVQGTGIYEVVSHKGNTIVRTNTWVPWNTNVMIRSIEIATVKGNPTEVDIFPVIHLKNLVERKEQIFLSRISSDQWLAVTVISSLSGKTGDIGKAVTGEEVTIFSHSLKPVSLTFHAKRSVPISSYSDPVYLLFAAGSTKEEALAQLKSSSENISQLKQNSISEWFQWHSESTPLYSLSPSLQYYWRVSNSLLRMSLQDDGSPIIIGFQPYQGNVWIRDGIWIVTTLALSGHWKEAKKGLYRLIHFLKKRPDGNYYFAYNVTTGIPNEHSFENDTPGLLLYGIWQVWSITKQDEILHDLMEWIIDSADWIVQNRDQTGLIREDAGIWETFGPHLGEKFEHMTWSSAISAYGLLKATEMVKRTGQNVKATHYNNVSSEILHAIAKNNVKNGIVVRSLETTLLDASVLLFFTEFPIFPKEWLLPTLEAIEQRIQDPLLGGIWRHESLTTEEGDMRPWMGPTFWTGEAFLTANKPQTAWKYFNHNYQNSSYCGLLPELLYSKGLVRGIGMPSYSQSGVIRSILLEKGNFHKF